MDLNQFFKTTVDAAFVVQDFRPIIASLECDLADLQWLTYGVKPFVTNEVPHLVNNTGRASEDAAALLFANCLEAGDDKDQIRVLELGAGLGLFARYFLGSSD